MEVLKIRDINGNWIEIPYLKGDIPGLSEYQKKLTAGENITIDSNNVISATGGGSGGIEIIDHNMTQAELLAMPSKLFFVPEDKSFILNVLLKDGNIVEYDMGNSLFYWNSLNQELNDITGNNLYIGDSNYFEVFTTLQIGDGLEDVDGAIRATNANCYNFKVNEESTVLGSNIITDLWKDIRNFTKYNLTFNGEPVHNVTKDEANNQLVFTVLRVIGTETQPGISRVSRFITFDIDEFGNIVNYVPQNAQNQITTVGHTDEQINSMIDTKLGVIENGSY